MTSLSSHLVEGIPNIDFVEEENLTPRAHVGKVMKTFRDVNSAKEIHNAERYSPRLEPTPLNPVQGKQNQD
jgi:hypothetical protein